MRISDWSSDVCSSDLLIHGRHTVVAVGEAHRERERHRRRPRPFDDPDAADLELAGEIFGRAAPQAAAFEPDIAAIVGDQPGPAVAQPQREIRLTLPRLPANQPPTIAPPPAPGPGVATSI